MAPQDIINLAVQRLIATAHPSKVILFGSRARGDATDESDLDLLVIEPKVENRGLEMVRLRNAVGPVGMGVDILVYSEEEVAERSEWCTSPVYWALREGKVLYDAQQQ